MKTLWQDVRFAWRMLLKTPVFTLIAVSTLAVGIGASTAIYSVVDQVIMNPFGYRDLDSLVKIWQTQDRENRGPGRMPVSIPNYLDWREQNTVFEDIGAYRTGGEIRILHGQQETERVRVFVATSNMPSVLGVETFLGRTFSSDAQQPGKDNVTILGYGLWQRYFGADPEVIGRTIRLDDRFYTVLGVMPKGYWQGCDAWAPLVLAGEAVSETSRPRPALSLWARMKAGITIEQARVEMEMIANRLEQQYPVANKGLGVSVWSRIDEQRETYAPLVWTLAGAVGFVLLVACANVAHLFLIRASAREKEVAIRTVYGAPRRRVIGQLLTEGVLISLLGGGLGIFLAIWGIRTIAAAGDHQMLPRLDSIEMSGQVLVFAVLASVFTGLLFSIVPALRASAVKLSETLKESAGRTSVGLTGKRFRDALFVSEVALTAILLVGAGAMVRNFWNLLQVPMGFNPDNMLSLQIELPQSGYSEPEDLRAYYQDLLPRIEAIPGARAGTFASGLPLQGSWSRRRFTLEGEDAADAERRQSATYFAVSPDYFLTLGVPVKLGRAFDEGDREGSARVAIVNETFVKRHFSDPNPLGRRLVLPVRGPDAKPVPAPHQIVGVVGDVLFQGPDLEAQAPDVIYVPYPQDPLPSVALGVRTGGAPEIILEAVRREVFALSREQAIYNAGSMRQHVRFALRQQRFTMVLISLFAGIALVLAAVGMYGMISYTVSQRTHEFGIRLAIGAERGDVVRSVLWRSLGLVVGGLVFGAVGSFALLEVLQSSLAEGGNFGAYVLQDFLGISTLDAWTCVAVALALVMVALAASYIPARRATKIDPMTALRYE